MNDETNAHAMPVTPNDEPYPSHSRTLARPIRCGTCPTVDAAISKPASTLTGATISTLGSTASLPRVSLSAHRLSSSADKPMPFASTR